MRKIILSALALLTIAATSCQKTKTKTEESTPPPEVKMTTIDAELTPGQIHNIVLAEVRRLHPGNDTTVGIGVMAQWVVHVYDSMFNDTINETDFSTILVDDLSEAHVLDYNQNLLIPSISLPILTSSTNTELEEAFNNIHTYKGTGDIVSYAKQQLDIDGLSLCEQGAVDGYISVLESSLYYWGGDNDSTRYLYRSIADADAAGYARGFVWGYIFSGGDYVFAKIHAAFMAISYSQNCKCVDYYQ